MPRKHVTIQLDGFKIPIDQFSEAMAGWVDQLIALRDELAPTAKINWVISELQKGSAICTILGEPEEGTTVDDVNDVLAGYENEWEAFKDGRLSQYSYDVQNSTRKIAAILNGQVTAIRTKTDVKEISISTQEGKSAIKLSKGFSSFGVVRGRVQTISTRSSNHFLLYDVEDDRKITCYLREGSEEIMKGIWGHEAIVEGELYRDRKTGVVSTVRDITVVELFKRHGSWRDAVGIEATSGVSPEEAVRRIRNG